MTQRAEPLALELSRAARRFGRRWALRGITMRVHPGEVVAVTGANGSGKSTLLRVAATSLTITSGEGTVFGHSIRREAGEIRPLVGLLGHSPGLYEDLTVAENLDFASSMLGRTAKSTATDEAMRRAGLLLHRGERVRTLSSGWQRRVALARLWMQRPRLLLLDEPYNSFDPDGVASVNQLITATRDAGGAALVVTHTLTHAEVVMDREVRLTAGVVSSAEAADESASKPLGLTTADLA